MKVQQRFSSLVLLTTQLCELSGDTPSNSPDMKSSSLASFVVTTACSVKETTFPWRQWEGSWVTRWGFIEQFKATSCPGQADNYSTVFPAAGGHCASCAHRSLWMGLGPVYTAAGWNGRSTISSSNQHSSFFSFLENAESEGSKLVDKRFDWLRASACVILCVERSERFDSVVLKSSVLLRCK